MHTRSSNKCHADLPSGPHEQVGVRRLTVATVGWLGPLPPNLGSRKDIPFAAGHTAAHAPPHSAWRGPPRVWGKETSASFRPDLRRTACGELVPRAGGQKRSKKEIFVKSRLGRCYHRGRRVGREIGRGYSLRVTECSSQMLQTCATQRANIAGRSWWPERAKTTFPPV